MDKTAPELPLWQRRTLAAVPEGEITLQQLMVAGIPIEELIVALAELVNSHHIVAWQERRGGRFTRFYRRLSEAERADAVIRVEPVTRG